MGSELQQIADLLSGINRKVDDLPANLKIAAKQIFTTGLSDINANIGKVTSGEVRTGNGKEPGYGFTGMRRAFPAMLYNSELWYDVSISDDVLQTGTSASDGKFYAGRGVVVLDSDGITLGLGTDDQYKIKFNSGTTALGALYGYIYTEEIALALNSESDGVLCTKSAVTVRASSVATSFESYIHLQTDDSNILNGNIQIKADGNICFFDGTAYPLYADLINKFVGVYVGVEPKGKLHVGGDILIGGDSSGFTGTVGLTNVTSGVSTGAGSVLMGGTTARNSSGWLKIMDGTTPKYIPFWTTIIG